MIILYKRHRVFLILLLLLSYIIAWINNVPFALIASDTITLDSIAIGVYTAAITLLIGSKTADAMKRPDHEIKTKTQMGVLIVYLKCAMLTGISSILNSFIVKMYCNGNLLIKQPYLYKVISSLDLRFFLRRYFLCG